MLKENPPTLSAHSGRYAFKSVSSHYRGGGGGGGGGIKSFIYRSCVGEGGEKGGGKSNLSSIDHVWGGGKGGEIMMGSYVD